MSIEWKPEAVAAAMRVFYAPNGHFSSAGMRECLNAAAAAQGLSAPPPQPVAERRWVSIVVDGDGLIGIASDGTAWGCGDGADHWTQIAPPPAPETTP